MNRKWLIVFAVGLVLFLPVAVYAHSGGTDSQGGHRDGSGGYHFHHGYQAHSHWDMDGNGDLDCPYDFVDKTGHNSGGSSGSSSGSSITLRYAEGYEDGYDKGYKDGVNAGKESGYDSGYGAGQRDAKIALEREYTEKLDKEKSESAWTAIVLFVFFAGPVLIGVHLYLTAMKVGKTEARHKEEMQRIKEENLQSENMAILKRISPGAEEYVQLPAGVRLNIACTPVKGLVTKDRPFGDFTVYVSENGARFHIRMGCSYASCPAHLYDCLGRLPPCRSCAKGFRETSAPNWYVKLKTGRSPNKEEKAEAPKFQPYAPQEPAARKPSAGPEPLKETWLSSPVIEKAAYRSNTLFLTFRGGQTYAYYNAPESLYDELIASSSAGTLFHQKIKDIYPYTIERN